MNKSILVPGALGIIVLVFGVMIHNPYLLVAGVILTAYAIIRFTRYINDQVPDAPEIPDLTNAKVTNVNVADLAHHMDDFMSLASPDPDYSLSAEEITARGLEGTMIYEYGFPTDVELKRGLSDESNPEPVDVYLGGRLVGAIPVKKSPYIYVLVGMKGIRYMEAEITGGNYKLVRNGRLEKGKREYRISLTIYADA